MLALIALLTLSVVTTWHSVSVHDDDHLHSVSIVNVHDEEPVDLDGAVHLAAHMVGQSLALPTETIAPVYFASRDPRWSSAPVAQMAGLDPASLLRPPQG